MFSTKFFAAAAASLSLIHSSTAVYDPSSQRNLAMYWGSGSGQQDLAHFCDQASVDIIPIGFINIFPPQANGLVAETFGNQCWNGNYTGPGYNGVNNPKNDFLYEQCPNLQRDLLYCQQKTNKKILLSLGGAVGNYYLNGAADGIYLAEFLWGAYGPYNPSWTGVRPLDRGYSNATAGATVDFDGFDFDIEHTSPDQQAGYIACIIRLRQLFAEHKAKNPCSKDYIISGAPQCPLDEAFMSKAIAGAQFDILWIQFYNNGANGCTARNYVDSKAAGKTSGFNYDQWVAKVNAKGSASAGAKLYIGLLAGQAASKDAPNDYIDATGVQALVKDYHSHPQFGGVMLYEATVAENNGLFQNQVKNILNNVAAAGTGAASTVCSSTVSSTSSKTSSTSSSYSSTKVTSTTSSKITTSSTSTKATSTSVSSTSSKTSSSSSSTKPTSSSTSSSSSSSSTLSSTSSSSLSSSSSSSSYPTTSPSSSTLSSSSSYPTTSSSSTLSSSSTTSTSTSETSTPTPTTVPSVGSCTYIGCYSEGTGVRALGGATYVNYTSMSVEICADFCSSFTYFGVEYGGECYCGNSFGLGSVEKPKIDCSMTCDGTPTELCGAGDRLDVYQCGATTSSSSVVSSSSSSVWTSSSVSLTTSSSEVTPTSSTYSVSSSSTLSSSSSEVTPTTSSTYIVSSSSTLSSSSSEITPSTSSYPVSSSFTLSSSSSEVTPSSTYIVSSSSSLSSSSSVSSTYSLSSSSSILTYTSSSVTSATTSSPYNISTSATSSSSTKSVGTIKTTTTGSSSSSIYTLPPYTNTSAPVTTSSTCSATGSGTLTITSSGTPTPTSYTTSTVYTTSVYTVTSCAPTVTNCPAHSTHLTTETIALYTTVCPVTATETGKGYPTTTPPSETKYTTSTVYTTNIYTVTACPASVTNCPAHSTYATTETIALYTTVCPVTATETGNTYPTTSAAVSQSYIIPGKGGKSSITYPAGEDHKTTTLSSTTTSYVTVEVVQSTATLVPIPYSASSSPSGKAPYPTGSESGIKTLVATGTAAPSVSLVIGKVSTTSAAGYPTSSTTPFTGGAARSGMSAVGVVVAVFAGLGLLI